MERHINIPIFIPHEGCPNNCVFCSQRTITGVDEKADRDITEEIDTALSTYTGKPENAEIAFFGGSFTGIDRNVMIKLLETAYSYVKSGKVSAIRLSTRPDYISSEILDILKNYGVTDIELGLQSMRRSVLERSNRGHSPEDAETACRLINEYGFNLVGQMMIGLPGSSAEDEIFTANEIVRMNCNGARIYPTVVFENTELCRMAQCGEYSPITIEQAIERSVAPYEIFVKNKVKVLRIGLQATEALISGSGVYAGANHPALGELIIGEYYCRLAEKIILRTEIPKEAKTAEIICAPGEQSKVSGQKKKNKLRLAQLFSNLGSNIDKISVSADKSVKPNELKIQLH